MIASVGQCPVQNIKSKNIIFNVTNGFVLHLIPDMKLQTTEPVNSQL